MRDTEQMDAVRISKEVERLDQNVRVIQHMLEDHQSEATEELVRLLRHLANGANRIAQMVEDGAGIKQQTSLPA